MGEEELSGLPGQGFLGGTTSWSRNCSKAVRWGSPPLSGASVSRERTTENRLPAPNFLAWSVFAESAAELHQKSRQHNEIAEVRCYTHRLSTRAADRQAPRRIK